MKPFRQGDNLSRRGMKANYHPKPGVLSKNPRNPLFLLLLGWRGKGMFTIIHQLTRKAMPDYIPQSDADFNVWQGNLIDIVEPNLTEWGIPVDELAGLKTKQSVWAVVYPKASNKQNRTAADVLTKDTAFADFEKSIRAFVAQWLTSNSKVTDSDRLRMGLTVKSGTRTAAPVPSSAPVGTVDFSVRLQHTINFSDEASPRSKAKPAGVHGCEIWMKVDGDAPKEAAELAYLATDTATPYVNTFEGKLAGKTVYYWLRWVNSRGERGPWSTTISAMVVG